MTAFDPLPDEDRGARSSADGTRAPVDIATDRRARRSWALLVAGPVIWFTHFAVVYLAAEAGCTGGGPGLTTFDPPVPVVLTLATTVVAVALCLAVARWAQRAWRGSAERIERAPAETTDPGSALDDDHRHGTLAFAGLLLALFSAVAVLFTGAPALVLGPC